MDRGAWWARVRGTTKSWTWLGDWAQCSQIVIYQSILTISGQYPVFLYPKSPLFSSGYHWSGFSSWWPSGWQLLLFACWNDRQKIFSHLKMFLCFIYRGGYLLNESFNTCFRWKSAIPYYTCFFLNSFSLKYSVCQGILFWCSIFWTPSKQVVLFLTVALILCYDCRPDEGEQTQVLGRVKERQP